MEDDNMEMRFPLILDGATGTQLQKRGYQGDVSAEQWVLDHPDSIQDVQRPLCPGGQPGGVCPHLRGQPAEAGGAEHFQPDGGV